MYSKNKEHIGEVEFDLGTYANMKSEKTIKETLEVSSSKVAGAQISIQVNI